jgi:hypothetical protein
VVEIDEVRPPLATEGAKAEEARHEEHLVRGVSSLRARDGPAFKGPGHAGSRRRFAEVSEGGAGALPDS